MNSAASALAIRPLSQLEQGIWKMDLGAPLNFTTSARISGPLDAQALEAALPAVRARHPHLRARVAVDGRGQPSFRHDDVPPLALRTVSGDWVHELEHEINQPFALQGPLGRFTLVRGPAGTYVLATLHHSVGDGMSGAFLMRDLIQAAAQALAGQTPKLSPLAEADSLDAQVPPTARGMKALGHHLRFALHEAWMLLRHGRPLKVRRDAHHFADARRARVIPVELEPELAERLAARARAERTTVHGALSAAMLLGILADANRERAGVAFGTPVNVRALLTPPVGEQLGFYVSMAAYRAQITSSQPFWELARSVRRSLELGAARGDPLAILDLMPRAMGLLGGLKLPPRELLERFERKAPTTTGLTNLGRLTIEPSHGPLKIEACHFAACPSALGDFLATATSLHGRLFWNFVWPDPVLTQAHATQLVNDIVERVKRAV